MITEKKILGMQIEVSIAQTLVSSGITHLDKLVLVSASLSKNGVLTLDLNAKQDSPQKKRQLLGDKTLPAREGPVVCELCYMRYECTGECQKD